MQLCINLSFSIFVKSHESCTSEMKNWWEWLQYCVQVEINVQNCKIWIQQLEDDLIIRLRSINCILWPCSATALMLHITMRLKTTKLWLTSVNTCEIYLSFIKTLNTHDIYIAFILEKGTLWFCNVCDNYLKTIVRKLFGRDI